MSVKTLLVCLMVAMNFFWEIFTSIILLDCTMV